MLRRSRQWLLCLFCVFIFTGPAGCSSSAPPDLDKETRTRLRKIHQAYALVYSMRNRFPRGDEEVRSVLNDLHDADLADEPDVVLRSPRDEQPFGLVFGVRPNDANSAIMIYEQQGAEGSRYVLTCSGEIRVLSDAEFASAPFAAGHSPGASQLADSSADAGDRPIPSR